MSKWNNHRLLLITFCIAFSRATYAQFAVSVEFGTPTNQSSCIQSGRSADRSCSTSYDGRSQATDKRSALANFSAQASVDKATPIPIIFDPPNARAEFHFKYSVPLIIKRAVEFHETGGGDYQVVVPQPSITLAFELQGMGLVTDDDPGEDGEGIIRDLRITSQHFGIIDDASPTLNWAQKDQCHITLEPYCQLSYVYFGDVRDIDSSWPLFLVEKGPSIGEIGSNAELPENTFSIWEDAEAPFATYDIPQGGFVQTLVDTLTIEVTLIVASTGNGPEYIACFGKQSPLSGFGITDDWCDGSTIFSFDEGRLQLYAGIANIQPPYSFMVAGSGPAPEPDPQAHSIPILNIWGLLLLTLVLGTTGYCYLSVTKKQ
jgi:hypothetical protein